MVAGVVDGERVVAVVAVRDDVRVGSADVVQGRGCGVAVEARAVEASRGDAVGAARRSCLRSSAWQWRQRRKQMGHCGLVGSYMENV